MLGAHDRHVASNQGLSNSNPNEYQNKPPSKLFEVKRSNASLQVNNFRVNNPSPKPTLPSYPNIEIPLYMRGKSKIGGGVTIPYQPSA